MNYERLLSLPKTELHCHLDGSLSLSCMSELLGRNVLLEEIQVADDCKDLAEYLSKFNLPLEGLQTRNGLVKGAIDFVKEVSKENIKYIEVRFAPMLSTNEHLSTRDVLEAVFDGLKIGENLYGVKTNVIASLMRHHTEDVNLEMVKIAREYLGGGLCAIDLAGNEAAFPMKMFTNVFLYANSLGIPYTVHAGECGSYQNVSDSISLGAKRIGHGIALNKNILALNYARSKNVGIEMCPISNLQTKAVKTLEEYPIKDFLRAGLLVTINTDNRTVSNTSLSKELAFVQDNFGVTDEEVFKILLNSINVSFASRETKEELKKNLLMIV